MSEVLSFFVHRKDDIEKELTDIDWEKDEIKQKKVVKLSKGDCPKD